MKISFEVGVNCNLALVERAYRELHAEKVFVTWRPDEKIEQLMATCVALAKQKLNVVPHVVARNLANRSEFQALLQICDESPTITSLFLLAGDATEVRGVYTQAADILRVEDLSAYSINTVYLAGYPEGHALISSSSLEQYLSEKISLVQNQNLAVELVTQLVSSLENSIEWIKQQAISRSLHARISVPIGKIEFIAKKLEKIYNKSMLKYDVDDSTSSIKYLEDSCQQLKLIKNKASIHLVSFHDVECLQKNSIAINTLLQSKLS